MVNMTVCTKIFPNAHRDETDLDEDHGSSAMRQWYGDLSPLPRISPAFRGLIGQNSICTD